METSVYQEFGNADMIEREPRIAPWTGIKRRLAFVLYGFLLLLLLSLLLLMGIKFSQLNAEMTDVKSYLGHISDSLKSIKESHKVRNPSSLLSSSINPGKSETVLLEELTSVRGPCNEGWGFFEGACYFLSTNKATWADAEKQCQAHGAHLLVLNNVTELDYISQVAQLWKSYWIGLVERGREGRWSWVDGTNFNSTPTFWDDGQPDDWDLSEHGEDCGQIHPSAVRKRRLWNDADCALRYCYICEARR